VEPVHSLAASEVEIPITLFQHGFMASLGEFCIDGFQREPHPTPAACFSNSSWRPSAWLYRRFLIFTQEVSFGVYSPSFRFATMPSRSLSQTTRNKSTPRASK